MPPAVAFLGASLSSDFTLMVTELCEGGTLTANLAAGRISWHKRGKQVGQGGGGGRACGLGAEGAAGKEIHVVRSA